MTDTSNLLLGTELLYCCIYILGLYSGNFMSGNFILGHGEVVGNGLILSDLLLGFASKD